MLAMNDNAVYLKHRVARYRQQAGSYRDRVQREERVLAGYFQSGQFQAGSSSMPWPTTPVCPRIFSRTMELHAGSCCNAAIRRLAWDTTHTWHCS